MCYPLHHLYEEILQQYSALIDWILIIQIRQTNNIRIFIFIKWFNNLGQVGFQVTLAGSTIFVEEKPAWSWFIQIRIRVNFFDLDLNWKNQVDPRTTHFDTRFLDSGNHSASSPLYFKTKTELINVTDKNSLNSSFPFIFNLRTLYARSNLSLTVFSFTETIQ